MLYFSFFKPLTTNYYIPNCRAFIQEQNCIRSHKSKPKNNSKFVFNWITTKFVFDLNRTKIPVIVALFSGIFSIIRGMIRNFKK